MNNFDYKMEAEKTIKKLKERIAELEQSMQVKFVSKLMADNIDNKAMASLLSDRIAKLEKENEKLKEYKWMYEGLCK